MALTALEQPLRATFRLTLLKAGDAGIASEDALTKPFGETAESGSRSGCIRTSTRQ